MYPASFLNLRPLPMPLRRLLVGKTTMKYLLFVEMPAEELEPDRKIVLRESAGDRDPGDARKVHADRENVRQIHLERVGGFFPYLERRSRGGRRGNDVDRLERLVEVLLDKRPHLLSLFVIGLV